MQPVRRLLSIEDNPVDAYLIQATFAALARRRPAAAFELVQARTLEEGLACLESLQPQVVLLDLWLPDASGAQAVARLRDARPDVPILVLSGRDDEQLAQRALQAGAQDYLVKGRFDMLLLDRMVLHAIERQRLASALDRAHRRELERRDEFLSHVSHELRTPLTAMEQFGSILGDGLAGPLGEEQKECVDVLRRNARHLRRMVDDLLEVVRTDTDRLALRRAPVDLAPVVRQTLAGLAGLLEAKGQRLETRLDAVRPAYADAMRIGQVLANLLENAVKFTPRGGTVRVCLGQDPDDSGSLRLSVIDDGCGIPADELPHVFDRLHQAPNPPDEASRRGLGLGLYISRQLVERHGGWIWAESSLGEGSRFHVVLPGYSLERLLDTLLVRGHGHDEPFHLVRVRVEGDDDRGPSARMLEALDTVVARCGDEAAGLVLPNRDDPAERWLVVRGTGPLVRSLVQRLRRRLAPELGSSAPGTRVTVGRELLVADTSGHRATLRGRLVGALEAHDANARQRRQASGTSRTSTQ